MDTTSEYDHWIEDLLNGFEEPTSPDPEPEETTSPTPETRPTTQDVWNFNWAAYPSGGTLDSLYQALARTWDLPLDEVDVSRGVVVMLPPRGPKYPHYMHYYCGSIGSLERLVAECSKQKISAHERIIGPMRPVLDVEIETSDLDRFGISGMTLLDKICEAVSAELHAALAYENRKPSSLASAQSIHQCIRVATSSDDIKCSYHVVVTGVRFQHTEDLKGFVLGVQNRLPQACKHAIDTGHPKLHACLRVLGTYKDGRQKIAMPGYSSCLLENLVCPPGGTDPFIARRGCCSYVAALGARPGAELPILAEADRVECVTLVLQRFPYLAYRPDLIETGYMNFDRTKPAHCDICDRTHDREGMYAWLLINQARICVRCRRDPSPGDEGHTLFIEMKPYLQRVCESKNLRGSIVRNPSRLYCEPKMEPYDLSARTLAIKASCGIGKTLGIFEYIDRISPRIIDAKLERRARASLARNIGPNGAPPSVEAVDRLKEELQALPDSIAPKQVYILFVSYRCSLTYEMVRKASKAGFPLESYQDIAAGSPIDLWNHPHVMVQVESLNRVTWNDDPSKREVTTPDIVILDEYVSILGQIDSCLVNDLHKRARNHYVFRRAIRSAHRVVALDALLDDWSMEILRAYRGEAPSIIHNNYKPHTGKRVRATDQKDALIGRMIEDLSAGTRMICPFHSKGTLDEIFKIVTERFPNLVIKKVTGDTDKDEKAALIRSPDEFLKGVAALFYTPAISAGVSFEVPGFDTVYAFFITSNTVITVSESVQMLFRNRVAKTYWIYIGYKGSSGDLPVSRADILEWVRTDENRLRLLVGAPEEIVHSMYNTEEGSDLDPRLDIYLYNKVAEFRACTWFNSNLIGQLADFGIAVEYWRSTDKALLEKLPDLRHSLAQARKDIQSHSAKQIANARDLNSAEAEMLAHAPLQDGQDRLALARYFLRIGYKYHGPMTEDWVREWGAQHRLQAFRRLNRLRVSGYDHASAVVALVTNDARDKEARRVSVRAGAPDPILRNLIVEDEANRDHEAEAHLRAYHMLTWIGFASGIDSTAEVSGDNVLAGLISHRDEVCDILHRSYELYQRRGKIIKNKSVTLRLIRRISNIMEGMYGVTIVSRQIKVNRAIVLRYRLLHIFDPTRGDVPTLNAYQIPVCEIYAD